MFFKFLTLPPSPLLLFRCHLRSLAMFTDASERARLPFLDSLTELALSSNSRARDAPTITLCDLPRLTTLSLNYLDMRKGLPNDAFKVAAF